MPRSPSTPQPSATIDRLTLTAEAVRGAAPQGSFQAPFCHCWCFQGEPSDTE